MGKNGMLVGTALLAGLLLMFTVSVLSVAGAETATAPPADIKPQPVNRASLLIEAPVVNLKGVQLGIAGDLIIGQDGCIQYLILSRGSAFGDIGPLVPVPWSMVERWQPPQPIMIDVEYDVMHGAPGFSKWPQLLEPALIEKVRNYFGVAP